MEILKHAKVLALTLVLDIKKTEMLLLVIIIPIHDYHFIPLVMYSITNATKCPAPKNRAISGKKGQYYACLQGSGLFSFLIF